MEKRPQPLDILTSFEVQANKLILRTTHFKVLVRLYGEEIFQVTAVRLMEQFSEVSYAVTAKPVALPEIDESGEFLILKTSSAALEIQKSPLRFTFKNATGETLNEDEPAFGTVFQGENVTTYKKLQPKERFLGLGEKTGGLDRRGKTYTNWNSDAFGYTPDSDPLYAAIPFYIGWHEGKGYGILFDNSFRSTFDFGASNDRFASFGAESGAMNYFLIGGNTIPDILSNYGKLTGKMPMPPRWAMGYQQCRYSYYPAQRVLEVARGLRRRQIPADVLYLDIHYMEQYKVFTWDEVRFPDPEKLVAELKEMGFRLVVIVDPGVKAAEGYHVFDSGQEADAFVKYPDGELYHGDVWPGRCVFPDFTDPKVRQWWGTFYEGLMEAGIAGFWNDMNEPAVWGQHVPSLVEFTFEGEGATHRQAHNVYGMQMARSTFEAVQRYAPKKRPFILTRAGFAGIQRYAALWTGDNVSYDDHMMLGVRIINSLGLSGVPFSGYDVGGFVGNPSPELYARWMQVGTFAPFFRAHTMINTPSAEPWSFGEETMEISRNFIRLRYKLMPYLYATFWEAAQNGMPIARSLALEFPDDSKIYDYENQFFFGKSLLVCPIKPNSGIQKVYLPEGEWYDFFTDQKYKGGQEVYVQDQKEVLPIFVRTGGIILASDIGNEVLQVHIYLGANKSTFTFFDDDGESMIEKENVALRTFTVEGNTLRVSPQEGMYESLFQKMQVFVHGDDRGDEAFRWIEPISNFDPFYQPSAFPFETKVEDFGVYDFKKGRIRIYLEKYSH